MSECVASCILPVGAVETRYLYGNVTTLVNHIIALAYSTHTRKRQIATFLALLFFGNKTCHMLGRVLPT